MRCRAAPAHIDNRSGTGHAAGFLSPGGLWQQWADAQPWPAEPADRRVDELCALVDRYAPIPR
ncbi:hypothetical protein GQS52_26790 [Streptomyces sp. SCUT-3]|uniref:DUF6000 family protein n=1 Tax=Streptomyces sp. SCUT-3 TaxID=2684469 RepID=UPI0015FC807F|nr:DUF6000 family protein [Streptomyces sp. SCUT-3]QMV22631.1 hypothetical protein GQS52_13515 [Streptomyces sp. SCUT-3]QMV24768.1 hypothetical protein GQS52_26790 [Streptomyces sp. SCUT-3]